MNPVTAALYSKLTGDGTLVALLASATSVYDSKAPEGASMPYVIVRKMSGSEAYTLSARSHRKATYLVKAVTESPADAVDAEHAGDIDERIRTVIGFDPTLTISGRTQMYTRRTGDMPDYEETKSDRTIIHRGGLYDVWST